MVAETVAVSVLHAEASEFAGVAMSEGEGVGGDAIVVAVFVMVIVWCFSVVILSGRCDNTPGVADGLWLLFVVCAVGICGR